MTVEPVLQPYEDVVSIGPKQFEALGDDPKMLWFPGKAQRGDLTTSGAVRVVVRMSALTGRLAEPCLYGDWGDGFSEDTRKSLTLVEEGVFTALLQSNAGALRKIRFDPSSQPCRFELSDFTVTAAAETLPGVQRLSPMRRVARRVMRRLPRPVQSLARVAKRAAGGDLRGLKVLVPAGRQPWRDAYGRAFDVARNLRSPHFAAPPLEAPPRGADGPKVVAFYLPQFHPIPQNDAWWGKGFTEWRNVTKAVPQFAGHLQPRLPADLGYYDLRATETMAAQVDLAKRVGVDAFCFHYYWFAGERLLERPLDAFLADETLDLPFALCWANENWTRRWDGQESDILIAQRHSPADDVAVFDDIARYIRSPRYLRVAGKPLILVYRPDALPDAAATMGRWRERARETGVGEIFLLCTNAFGFGDYRGSGFDGLTEFPPHALSLGEITHAVQLLNAGFSGRVYDYEAVVPERISELIERKDPRHFPGIMPAWDNEARKPGAGHVFHNATPEPFYRWAKAALDFSLRSAPAGERLVFVNAWNEWAEGAYLEPDRWFGHGPAQALRAAIEAGAPRLPADHPVLAASQGQMRNSDKVVLLHLHYADLIEGMGAWLRPLADQCDIAVTIPEHWPERDLLALAAALPKARIELTPNVGRDVAPFIAALRRAQDAGYEVFCKIHSKRSPHMSGGAAWRETLLSGLLDPAVVAGISERFAEAPKLGLLAAARSRASLSTPDVMFNNRALVDHVARRLKLAYGEETPFVAGTMFWGRVVAFGSLVKASPEDLAFETELGRIDGTLAHALERLMGAIVVSSGHDLDWSL